MVLSSGRDAAAAPEASSVAIAGRDSAVLFSMTCFQAVIADFLNLTCFTQL